jgi:hypothetical protein
LRFLYNFWKIWSFVWLTYSMILVETTLNFNHVQGVLGGPKDNELHLPAQLLPLLIGVASFARILWLTFTAFREPGDEVPSLAVEDGRINRSRSVRMGASLMLLFSPAMSVDAPKEAVHEDDEIDPEEAGRSRATRYFVSMYPWFSLLSRFGARPDDGSYVEKRLSYDKSPGSPSRGLMEREMAQQLSSEERQRERQE